jgi:uncharacterized integral membrane protein
VSTQGSVTSPGGPLPSWLSRRSTKIAIWIVLLVAAGIIVWQNWITVETPVLFITLQMPRSLLLVLMMVIGFVLGVTVRLRSKAPRF